MASQGEPGSAEFDAAGISRANTATVSRVLVDLVVVTLVTAATVGLAVYYGEQGGPAPLRVPLGFLFIFFIPGYALVSALFPRGGALDNGITNGLLLSPLERIVLSVGLSLALVPLVGLGLTLVSQPLGLRSVLFSLGSLTVGGVTVAAIRRFRTPARERFHVTPVRALSRTVRYSTANAVNLLLVFAIALAVAGIGVAVLDSGDGDRYTELSILGEDEDGELGVDNLPAEITVEEPEPLHVTVTNHEHEAVDYTVVVLLQELDENGNVVESDELDRFVFALAHGDQLVHEHEVEPTLTGDNLRLTYLLYTNGAHENPTLENAEQSVHITVNVVE